MRLFLLTQLTAFALSLFSCSNLLTEVNSPKDIQNTNATGSVTGSFTYNGAIPQEFLPSQNSNNGKTAFASAVPSEYIFTVQATASDGNSISGSTTDDKTAYILSGLTLDKEYTITITATKTISGNTVTVFQGSDTVTLTSTSPMVDKNISLNAIQTSDNKTGTVNLKVTVPNENYHLESSSERFVCTQDSTDRKIWIITIKETYSGQLNSKSYNTSFNVYSDSSKTTLLYSFSEIINLFDGLETNTWVKNSASNGDAHLTLQEGQSYIADCIITPELISKFQSTTLYVDSTDSNSTENGTFDNPYKTLQAAVDNIVTYGNSTDNYTIYLRSNLSQKSLEHVFSFTQSGVIRNITIAGYTNVKTISNTSSQGKQMFYLEPGTNSTLNITLRDLILESNFYSATYSVHGAAIYNKQNSNLTLNNVTIKNFYISITSGSTQGGAIHNEGKLIINDAVISKCTLYSVSFSYGGGIYNSGTCSINKAIITECKLTKNSSSTSHEGKGGGIYNEGILTLGDSVCSSDNSPDVIIGIGTYNGTDYNSCNECTLEGAGVYSSGTLTMNNDCVIGKYNPTTDTASNTCGNYINNTNTGVQGVGLYIKGTVNINGGYISANYGNSTPKDCSGVGIYINSETQLTIKNVHISYNHAQTSGTKSGVGLYISDLKSIPILDNIKVYNNNSATSGATNGKGAYFSFNSASNYKHQVQFNNSCYFSDTNDFYLESGSTIQLESDLTPSTQFCNSCQYTATLTPSNYSNTNPLLTVKDGGSAVITNNYDKFKISDSNSGKSYILDLEAKLLNKSDYTLTNSSGAQTYYIFKKEDLSTFANPSWQAEAGDVYLLMDDIVLPDDFNTIFTKSAAITFDGNNHTISNLTKPLFNVVYDGSEIKNLTVNLNATNNNQAGLAITNIGTIENCKVTGSFNTTLSSTYVGGVVQENKNTGIINNCENNCTITVTNNISLDKMVSYYIGGIAGINRGTVSNCKFSGTIQGGVVKSNTDKTTERSMLYLNKIVANNDSGNETDNTRKGAIQGFSSAKDSANTFSLVFIFYDGTQIN